MPVSCVLSNMMLQGIRVCALVIIGFTAVSYGEPAYRRHRTLGYQINNNNKNINTDDDNNSSFDPVTVNCTGTRADSPECRLFKVKPKNDTISDVSNEKNSPVENIDKEKPWSITDLFYDDGDDSAVEEGRGKKKKKGKGGYILMAAAAMKATMLWVMVHATAVLAGKAFVLAKIALVLAGVIALKKSLEHHDKTSYEIVKHPQHSYSQSHSSSIDYDHHGGFEGHRRRR
ncbi:uncharacterized protein LOC103571870 [Microplitis demolitor]|uniref:uncharacterized protein LOC103571870 n=1 Tax=Microplitis demolitor TaxID=69319 RepID=UPI0004CCDC86|nr:uncharacterized protein LOC103571870 [Microplitis demolitor]